jgi:ribosomal protein S18 acetylase RimI-like enzyme
MFSSPVTYRTIEESDYSEIETIESEEYNGEDDLIAEELEQMFAEPNLIVDYEGLVAEYQGKIIGYLISMVPADFPKFRHVMRLMVTIEARRQGVGSELLDRIEPTKLGHRVSAEVPEDDYASAAFLKANKYIVTTVVTAEYSDDGELEMEGYYLMAREQKVTLELSQRLTWSAK